MRKFIAVLIAIPILFAAICGTVSAATYEPYESNISTTQLTYFQDILAGQSILDHYVFLRDGQYTYKMIVGDLEYKNNQFIANDTCKVYSLDTGSGYNSNYSYSVDEINNITVNTNSRIVYSDLGDYPQLEERGTKYEILTAITLCIFGCCFIIRNIFYKR